MFLLIPWYLGKIIIFYKGLSLLSAVLVCRVDMSLAACFSQKTVYNFKYCKLCMTLLGWQWEGYQWFLRYDVESVGPIYGHLQINLEVSQISIHAKTLTKQTFYRCYWSDADFTHSFSIFYTYFEHVFLREVDRSFCGLPKLPWWTFLRQ